jgi:hypothetical protein
VNARNGRARPAPLRAVLGTVAGLAVVWSMGMVSDRTIRGRKPGQDVGPPIIVKVSGSGVTETELDGPDDAGAPAREAAGQVDEATPNQVPRFLGTFSLSGETRAIFEIQGTNKPWMGKAGERILGTDFMLETFDGSSARIVPLAHR